MNVELVVTDVTVIVRRCHHKVLHHRDQLRLCTQSQTQLEIQRYGSVVRRTNDVAQL